MRRSGFTLIELVFVIVILGILAAVAVPRLAGVQDDALIATEEAGVGAIRSGIAGVKAKIALASGTDLNITVVKADGASEKCTITKSSDTTSGNPNYLSVAADYKSTTQTAKYLATTLALVLDDPNNRTQWATDTAAPATSTKFVGPASTNLASSDETKYDKGGSWLYVPSTGSVLWQQVGF